MACRHEDDNNHLPRPYCGTVFRISYVRDTACINQIICWEIPDIQAPPQGTSFAPMVSPDFGQENRLSTHNCPVNPSMAATAPEHLHGSFKCIRGIREMPCPRHNAYYGKGKDNSGLHTKPDSVSGSTREYRKMLQSHKKHLATTIRTRRIRTFMVILQRGSTRVPGGFRHGATHQSEYESKAEESPLNILTRTS